VITDQTTGTVLLADGGGGGGGAGAGGSYLSPLDVAYSITS
jgi:hypothetical protein